MSASKIVFPGFKPRLSSVDEPIGICHGKRNMYFAAAMLAMLSLPAFGQRRFVQNIETPAGYRDPRAMSSLCDGSPGVGQCQSPNCEHAQMPRQAGEAHRDAIAKGVLAGAAVDRMERDAIAAVKAARWEEAYGKMLALANATRNSPDRCDVEKASDLVQLSMLCWNTNRKKQAVDILQKAINLLKTGRYLGGGCESHAVSLETRMAAGRLSSMFTVDDIVGDSGVHAQIMAKPIAVFIGKACESHEQVFQAKVPNVVPEQVFAQYQSWLQNADMQLRQRTAMMPPAMQLQCSIRAIEGELSQWGGFLQEFYPMVYASRCVELQQRRKMLAQMMNGWMSMPLPAISPGGGFAGGSGGRPRNRCIACRGSGMCRQCKGTGVVYASYGGSGSWTCTSCKGSGRCTICGK